MTEQPHFQSLPPMRLADAIVEAEAEAERRLEGMRWSPHQGRYVRERYVEPWWLRALRWIERRL